MKKVILSLTILSVLLSSNYVFAEMFDNLTDLSPIQKQKLTQTYFNYKQQNNALETKIMDYTNKLNQLKTDATKSRDELSLLSSTYERNLYTLKNQQKTLKDTTDNAYKSIMTVSQYKQYQEQQMQAEDAFSKFLIK